MERKPNGLRLITGLAAGAVAAVVTVHATVAGSKNGPVAEYVQSAEYPAPRAWEGPQ